MAGPTKLNSVLVQRLDTMLGTNIGQQSIIGPANSPKAVYQPGTADKLQGLKNPPEQDLINRDLGQNKQQADKATVGKALRQMELDNLIGRQSTLKTATQSAPTTLGYTARIILALFNKFPDSNRTIHSQTPLLPDPKQAQTNNQTGSLNTRAMGQTGTNSIANVLLQNLSQSIQNSGLFYESHLAKLTQGNLSPKELRLQPQNNPDLKLSHGNLNTAGKNININLPNALNNLLLIDQDQSNDAKLQTQQTVKANANTSSAPVAQEQLQNIVRQQLEVLANHSFIWKGEAWPGMSMECEISRYTEEQADGSDDDSDETVQTDKHWATRLNIELPKLGTVNINLNLQSNKLNIHIVAPQSGERLQQSSKQLVNSLLAQGIQTQQVLIDDQDLSSSAGHIQDEDNGQ